MEGEEKTVAWEKKWKRKFNIEMVKCKEGKVGFNKNAWVFNANYSYPFGLQADVGQCFSLAGFLCHK